MPGPRGPLTLTHCADSTPVLPLSEINSRDIKKKAVTGEKGGDF